MLFSEPFTYEDRPLKQRSSLWKHREYKISLHKIKHKTEMLFFQSLCSMSESAYHEETVLSFIHHGESMTSKPEGVQACTQEK